MSVPLDVAVAQNRNQGSTGKLLCSINHVSTDLIKRTICPRSSYPFYIVTYKIKWVTTSWIDGTNHLIG